LVIKYGHHIARVNTGSLSSAVSINKPSGKKPESAASQASGTKEASALKVLAFKALPARSSFITEGQERQALSEKEFVDSVCDEIRRLAGGTRDFVEATDIVSLADAKKGTGLVEILNHSLKRMVWG